MVAPGQGELVARSGRRRRLRRRPAAARRCGSTGSASARRRRRGRRGLRPAQPGVRGGGRGSARAVGRAPPVGPRMDGPSGRPPVGLAGGGRRRRAGAAQRGRRRGARGCAGAAAAWRGRCRRAAAPRVARRRWQPPRPAPGAPGARCGPAGPRATCRPASLVSRTRATSSSSRGSGAWRNSTSVSPSTSMARTVAAGPSRLPWSATRSRGAVGQVDERRARTATGRRRAAGRRGARPACAASRPAAVGRARRRPAPPACPGRSAPRRCRRAARRSSATPPAATTCSSADRVSRAEPPPWRSTASMASSLDVEPGVGHHPADVLLELVHRQEVELEVLGAADDRRADLLRVGGGQHEHDVGGRLLERLQQRGLGRLRQHVDLVEDVHLVAARACRASPCSMRSRMASTPLLDGGVELVDVVAGAGLHGEAGGALAARLAVDRPLAVQDLGQDAGRRRLARAPRAR